MSKTRTGRPANDARPQRRSLVELTGAVSRAVDDGLLVTPASSTASSADHLRPLEFASERPARTEAPEQAEAATRVASAEAPNMPARSSELAASDSAAEMMVKIAKDYQNSVLESIRGSLSAALDHARDFAETRRGSEAAGNAGVENDVLMTVGAAAAAFRAEALELMKTNVVSTLEYARELAGTRTAAEFVELSGTQVRKSCELMLKQTDALKSLTQAVAKERPDRT